MTRTSLGSQARDRADKSHVGGTVDGGCLSHGLGPVRIDQLIDSAEEARERSERDTSG